MAATTPGITMSIMPTAASTLSITMPRTAMSGTRLTMPIAMLTACITGMITIGTIRFTSITWSSWCDCPPRSSRSARTFSIVGTTVWLGSSAVWLSATIWFSRLGVWVALISFVVTFLFMFAIRALGFLFLLYRKNLYNAVQVRSSASVHRFCYTRVACM